jgi:hypothetical protein
VRIKVPHGIGEYLVAEGEHALFYVPAHRALIPAHAAKDGKLGKSGIKKR